MGSFFTKEPTPPVVLVPPMFDFPPLAARTRMLESSYDSLFGKLALKCLFDDYFEEARHFSSRIMLKSIDDPNVDLVATASGPLDHKPEENFVGNALFRWQSDVDDPHTFMDLFVSNSDTILRMRSCAYYPKYGFGAFGTFPMLVKKRMSSKDFGVMGLRYGSENLSVGASLVPFSPVDQYPNCLWLVSKIGRLTAGVQYEPPLGSKDSARFKDLENWSCAIGYGVGSGGPLSPTYNFCLEFAKNSQFIASFYQHAVVQRRVKNPLEESEVVGITNYIDFGFELQTSVDDAKTLNSISDSTFQVAASWQANKNLLLKGKVGPLRSTIALAFKSWWKPSFTLSMSATRDRASGNTALGFGLRAENLREASYERADPNFVMLTPSKEHMAEGKVWNVGNHRPMLQADVKDEPNFDQPDPVVIVVDNSSISRGRRRRRNLDTCHGARFKGRVVRQTRIKLAAPNESDKQQLQLFCNACKGITQGTYPAFLHNTSSAVAPATAPPPAEDLELAMAINASIQSAIQRPPLYTGQTSSEANASTSWNNTVDLTSQSGCSGPVVHEDGPSQNLTEHVKIESNTPDIIQTTHETFIPSAPLLSTEIMDEGPIHYPSIDCNPVDLTAPVLEKSPGGENEKKGDGSASSCVICLDAPVEGACIPCGHMAGCMSCLNEIKAKKWGCPVCRSKIEQIIRLYAV